MSKKPNRLRKLQITKVALVDAGAGKGVAVELFKRREGARKEQVKKMSLEDIMAAIGAMTPEQKAQIAALVGKAADPEMTEEEKAKKAAAEEAEKAVAKAKAEKDAEIVELKKRLADIEKTNARKDLVARVEKSMRGLPGKTEEIVAELESIADTAAREVVAKRYETLSAERLELAKKAGLMTEIGSGREGGGTDPARQFDDLVAKAMKDEDIKKKSDAVVSVAKRHPDLYAQVQKERAA